MPETELAGVRVVLVNSFPGPDMGGGEVLAIGIVRALAASGAAVVAVAPLGSLFGDALAADGVEVERAPLALPALPRALGAIRRAAGAGAVLVGTGYFSNLLARLARRPGRDRVLNMVGVMPGVAGRSRAARTLRRLVDRSTLRRVDAFAASASAIAGELRRRGVETERITVIPNAIDADAIRAQAGAALPDGFPSRRPVIACAARLEPVKGVEDLIRAMPSLPGAALALAGTGSLDSALHDLAAKLRVGERVSFLGWVARLAAVLRAADVVVLPSRSEGLPLVALEAMALGRPVVATAVGGTPETVEHGVTGLLVPPADPDALAAALRGLLADPSRAAAMGAAGRRRVDERFGMRALGAAYVRLVHEVAHGATGGREQVR